MNTSSVDPRLAQLANQFFVVGGQKCGTTWLHHYLKSHPNVCVPVWKELNYWNKCEGSDVNGYLRFRYEQRFKTPLIVAKRLFGRLPALEKRADEGILTARRALENAAPPHSAYADALLAETTDQVQAWGECCPQYARLSADSYRAMFDLTGDAKFIFMMRDPLDRFVSSVKHLLRLRDNRSTIEFADMAAALSKQIGDPKAWAHSASRYDLTIARLEAEVPAQNIKYVFYEDLFAQAQIDQLCAFIGVPCAPANVARKLNVDPQPEMQIPSEISRQIVTTFLPIYDLVHEKFGDAVPAAWLRSRALIESADG